MWLVRYSLLPGHASQIIDGGVVCFSRGVTRQAAHVVCGGWVDCWRLSGLVPIQPVQSMFFTCRLHGVTGFFYQVVRQGPNSAVYCLTFLILLLLLFWYFSAWRRGGGGRTDALGALCLILLVLWLPFSQGGHGANRH